MEDGRTLMLGFSKGVLILLTLVFVLGTCGIGRDILDFYQGKETDGLNVRGLHRLTVGSIVREKAAPSCLLQ